MDATIHVPTAAAHAEIGVPVIMTTSVTFVVHRALAQRQGERPAVWEIHRVPGGGRTVMKYDEDDNLTDMSTHIPDA